MNTLLKTAIAGLALLASTAPRAEILKLAWNADGAFASAQEIAPGKFAEACGPLKAGEQVAWSFEADGPLNFNIHFHEGEKVTYPARENGVSQRKGELKVPQGQDYCWMWSNKGTQPVKLKLELQQKR